MKTILILFIMASFLSGCSKKDDDGFKPTLPPITQTGENTFGCYVNGKLITPRDGTGTFNSPDRGMMFVDGVGYYEVSVHDFASDHTATITLHLIGLDSLGAGTYIVNESNCWKGLDSPITNNVFCRIWDSTQMIYKFYCSTENSGVINITRFDNGIISGTFSCTAVNQDDPSELIEITNGRFDINRSTVHYTNYP